MTNSVGFRPKLLPPRGRQLEQSYRPLVTCLVVSGCLTVLVGVVFGLTAFNIYSHRFGNNQHRYHAGDEMSLRQAGSDLSPTFCSAYTVQPMGRTTFYLFPHQAELDPSQTVPISFRLTADPRRRFVHSTYYLLVNSTVRLSACYHGNNGSTSDLQGREHDEHSPAMILVIVGDDHFQEWLKHYNLRHVRHKVPVPQNAACGNPRSVPTLALTVPGSNNYHFVLMSRRHPSATHRHERGGARAHYPMVHSIRHAPIDRPTPTAVNSPFPVPPLEWQGNLSTLILSGSVNKTQFDLTGPQALCQAASETSCSFPLQWGSHPDVVAQISPVSATQEKEEVAQISPVSATQEKEEVAQISPVSATEEKEEVAQISPVSATQEKEEVAQISPVSATQEKEEVAQISPVSATQEKEEVAQISPVSATEEMEEIPHNEDAPVSFVTRCGERWEFWIPVFGGLPVVIIVSLWVWCWCLLVRRRSVRSRYHVRMPTSGGRGGRSRASYGSIDGESRAPLVEEVPDSAPLPLPPEHEHVVSQSDEPCASIQG